MYVKSILEFAKCFLLLFHLKFTITSDFIKFPLHLTHEEIKVKEITDLKITQLKEVDAVTKLLHMTKICPLCFEPIEIWSPLLLLI